jgi:hypothetical protein
VAFRENEHVGTRIAQVFAAQWLAYVLPCRRFAATLAGDSARLGAGADRYSFTVVDLHLLLLAGFTGAPKFKTWHGDWSAEYKGFSRVKYRCESRHDLRLCTSPTMSGPITRLGYQPR